jgi:hypothetical protein
MPVAQTRDCRCPFPWRWTVETCKAPPAAHGGGASDAAVDGPSFGGADAEDGLAVDGWRDRLVRPEGVKPPVKGWISKSPVSAADFREEIGGMARVRGGGLFDKRFLPCRHPSPLHRRGSTWSRWQVGNGHKPSWRNNNTCRKRFPYPGASPRRDAASLSGRRSPRRFRRARPTPDRTSLV